MRLNVMAIDFMAVNFGRGGIPKLLKIVSEEEPASARIIMCGDAGLLSSTCLQRVQSEGQIPSSSPRENG